MNLILIIIYFILGLIISSLILYYNENIDAYHDRFFLFSIILLYPVIIPLLISYYILMKSFQYIQEIKKK